MAGSGSDAGAPRFDLLFDPRRLAVDAQRCAVEAAQGCAVVARAPEAVAQAVGHLQAERGARATVDLDGRLRGDEDRGSHNVLAAWAQVRAERTEGVRPGIAWLEAMNERLLQGLGAGTGPRWRQHMIALGRYRAPHPQRTREALAGLLDRLDVLVAPRIPASRRPALALCRAVLAHVHVALIHPFAEGNGRTARMLESALLLEAGVPEPSVHLLAVHYEHTRSEYLDGLARVSQDRDAAPFVGYALRGLAEGVRPQVAAVREAARHAAYPAHARGLLGDSVVGARRLALALALRDRPGGVRRSDLGALRVAGPTGEASDAVLARDLGALRGLGLVAYHQGRWRVALDAVPLDPEAGGTDRATPR